MAPQSTTIIVKRTESSISTAAKKDDGWWLRFRSVVVFGRIEFVENPAVADRVVRRITKKFIEDEEYFRQELLEAGDRTLVFALVPEHMTGKTVNER